MTTEQKAFDLATLVFKDSDERNPKLWIDCPRRWMNGSHVHHKSACPCCDNTGYVLADWHSWDFVMALVLWAEPPSREFLRLRAGTRDSIDRCLPDFVYGDDAQAAKAYIINILHAACIDAGLLKPKEK